MLLFPDHSTLLICISKIQMENAARKENKMHNKGLTWDSSVRLNWEFCTPNSLLPLSGVPQDSWGTLWALHEVLWEKMPPYRTFWWQNISWKIICSKYFVYQLEVHNTIPKGKLTQTGQSFWMGFHSSFFLTLFLPPFAQRWKWKVFSGRWSLGHWALQQTHFPQNLGFSPLSF